MRASIAAGRLWHLASAALVGGAALLALYSGDLLLILAVLSAAGGLFVLARPVPARPAPAVGIAYIAEQRPQPAIIADGRRRASRSALPVDSPARRAQAHPRLRDAS